MRPAPRLLADALHPDPEPQATVHQIEAPTADVTDLSERLARSVRLASIRPVPMSAVPAVVGSSEGLVLEMRSTKGP